MSERIKRPTILVIVGISGDLSKRYLLPSIRQIARSGVLPESFRVVGVTRRKLTEADVVPEEDREIGKLIELYTMDMSSQAAYNKLAAHLEQIEAGFGEHAQFVFYLSIPPETAPEVTTMLGEAGLFKRDDTELMIEKPFGTNLESAQELVDHLTRYCKEEQIYRIDHYLAKEMAQNIVILRSGNALFRETWNKDFIESIEITAAEQIGIENRTVFYEQTGALRDMIQGHILQLAALTLMDLPKGDLWQGIPKQRLKALKALQPPTDVAANVTRGQYIGYRKDVGVADSVVESFVSLTLYSSDPRWEGVPITLTTGKALEARSTEIRIRYRSEGADAQGNELVLRVQPNEGLTFSIWVKRPGYEREMQPLPMVLNYGTHYESLPNAYERVFVDAMRGDHALFTTSAEVLASWRILAPIQAVWKQQSDDLIFYERGHSPLTQN